MTEQSQASVKIIEQTQDYTYRRFTVQRARLQYRRADGQMSEPVTRLRLERGNTVAVLLYDSQRDRVLCVRQFRYPVYSGAQKAGDGAEREKDGWLLEIVAGVIEEGQGAEETARREVREEAGYAAAGAMRHIADVYLSPGISSERMTIFLAEIDSERREGQGGGVAAEGEDTELVVLSRREALAMLAAGQIHDGKTVIALQFLAAQTGPVV